MNCSRCDGVGCYACNGVGTCKAEEDRLKSIVRAGHDCVCEVCGKIYLKHPYTEDRSSDGYPYLNQLCDGRIVKL